MRHPTRRPSVVLVALLAVPLAAQQDPPLPEPVQAALGEQLAAPLQPQYDALFDLAQLHAGTPATLLAALRHIAGDDAESAERRRTARWIAGFCAWRGGALDQALGHVRAVADGGQEPLVLLRRAQLFDALGRIDDAVQGYQAALTGGLDEQAESGIRLRLALLHLDQPDSDAHTALAAFARAPGRDPELRNRAANVLALTGRPKEALELYQVDGEGTERFRDEVRLATWAIRAGDAAQAQELAWRARAAAQLDRDRHYALSVLVEAHRLDRSLDRLIQRFAATPELDQASRQVWVELLRETGQVDAAVALLRSGQQDFSVELQRQLVEMYRESGREDRMVATYRELIQAEPERMLWREGLSRHLLERGATDEARAVWADLLADRGAPERMLPAARALSGLSLDDLAMRAAEVCIEADFDRYPALMFLFELEMARGRLSEAGAVLDRLDGLAPPDDGVRAQLAEGYEQLGRQERAVAILEGLRTARGSERLAEDLEMRLCWLYSEVDREDQAMTRWRELWHRVESVPRRRYVEDRLMTVASRLGRIAELVVELEEKLAAGTASQNDSALLVRLYSKVNDPVSAAEVIEEYFKRSGGRDLDVLNEKARIYLACTDYANYEGCLRSLMAADPEGEGEYLRQLVMSQLERGRPDEARDALARLRGIEVGADSAEFEAGVLGLAGLYPEAMDAYRKGIAAHPDRIEIYLLLANLMKDGGQTAEAVGMFQHLAETADKDDLFTIAIDGLLNMEARGPVLQWARRITLERMARRHDRMYLYQLLADLAEETQDHQGVLDALEGSLAIAGPRRPSILRELMDLAKGGRAVPGRPSVAPDRERHLAYGRRLIALDEAVPPQVYLDLGEAFLQGKDVRNAVKTFALAKDVPDQEGFQRQVAELFERAGYLPDAMRTYEAVLISSPTDVGLLAKVAGLKEQVGRDDVARELYRRALLLLMAREVLATDKIEKEPDGRPTFFARNLDDFQRYYPRILDGLLVTLEPDDATALLERLDADLQAGLDELRDQGRSSTIATHPRIERLAACIRRLCIAFGRTDDLERLDLGLLAALPGDPGLLEALCRERMQWGRVVAARALVEKAPRPDAEKARLRFLVGSGELSGTGLVPVAQAARLVVPPLLSGDTTAAATLLLRTDFNGLTQADLPHLQVLFSTSLYLGNQDLTLSLARTWMRLLLADQRGAYLVEQLYRRCARLLDAERRQSLVHYLVSLIVGDLDKAKGLLRLLPELQRTSTQPILDAQQAADLLGRTSLDYPYGMGPVLALLAENDRAAAVRDLWAKVPKTARVRFLLTLTSEFPEPMGPGLTDFVVGALGDSLRDDDEKFLYYEHYLDQLQRSTTNLAAARAIAETMVRLRPKETTPVLLLAATLHEQGEAAEAVKVAADAVRARIADPDENLWRRTQQSIAQRFLPAHQTELLAAVDGIAPQTPMIARRRIDLVDRTDDPAALIAALEHAVAQFPADSALRLRLGREYVAAGRRLQSLRLLEEQLGRDPKDAAVRSQLAALWQTLRHPIRAREVRAGGPAAPAAGDPGAPLRPGRTVSGIRALPLLPVGTARASAAAAAAAAEDDPDKLPVASVQQIKLAMDKGDQDAARLLFRRFWRWGGGSQMDERVAMLVASGQIVQPSSARGGDPAWPVDRTQPDPEAPAPAPADLEEREDERTRGGLAGFREEDPQPAQAGPRTYEVLAQTPFGAAEMARQVRAQSAAGLEYSRHAVDGLRVARAAAVGESALFVELRDAVLSGRAGKLEYIQLLDLLQEQAVPAGTAPGELLRDLAATVDPNQGADMMRLARVHARLGETDRARRLYHWCATLTGNERLGLGTAGISPQQLVADVKQHLAGADRETVVETILELAAPPEQPYALESYELLVIDTWEEILGPVAAMTRCRKVCEGIADLERGLRRRAALRAAVLHARNGEIEAAVRCLEIGICRLPTAGLRLQYAYLAAQYDVPGMLAQPDLRKLFPADGADFTDRPAWLRAVAAAMPRWIDEGRVRTDNALQALSVLTVRLHEAGCTDDARALVTDLARRPARADDRLWIADAARTVGAADLAHAIERALLDQGELNVVRIHEVVARIAEAEGPASALQVGEQAAEYTLHHALLARLASLAEQAGKAERAAHWRAVAVEARKARTEARPAAARPNGPRPR